MQEFQELLNDESKNIKVIDVRTEVEFADGHVEDAVNLPVEEIVGGEMPADKEATFYLICRSGARSALAAEQLNSAGYQAINVQGGMLAYEGPAVKY